jgi:CrcB protein
MMLTGGWPEGIAPIVWIGLGGALGAAARYWLGSLMVELMGAGFPWGTLVVNLVGCFLIGVVMTLMGAFDPAAREMWRFALVVGFLGSFTTFSTFSYEGMLMLREGAWLPWIGYAGGSVFGGLVMVLIGMRVAT